MIDFFACSSRIVKYVRHNKDITFGCDSEKYFQRDVMREKMATRCIKCLMYQMSLREYTTRFMYNIKF